MWERWHLETAGKPCREELEPSGEWSWLLISYLHQEELQMEKKCKCETQPHTRTRRNRENSFLTSEVESISAVTLGHKLSVPVSWACCERCRRDTCGVLGVMPSAHTKLSKWPPPSLPASPPSKRMEGIYKLIWNKYQGLLNRNTRPGRAVCTQYAILGFKGGVEKYTCIYNYMYV